MKSTDPNRLLWVGGADENVPRGHPTLLRVPAKNGVVIDDRVLPLPSAVLYEDDGDDRVSKAVLAAAPGLEKSCCSRNQSA